MSEEKQTSCVEPARGLIEPTEPQKGEELKDLTPKGGDIMCATVGKKAPDFEAAAYHKGEFKNIKLSDFKGKWVALCFYPGDFTFV